MEMRPTSTKDTERFNGVNFSVMRMPQLSNSNKEVSPRLKKKKMLVLQGPDSGIYASLQQADYAGFCLGEESVSREIQFLMPSFLRRG